MANLILDVRGGEITFKAAAATPAPTIIISLPSLTTANGRISDRLDRGTVSAPTLYVGRATIKLAVAAVIGVTFTIYRVLSDASNADGGLSAVDAALSGTDWRRNVVPICVIVAQAATVGPFSAPIDPFMAWDRNLQLAVLNEMGQTLTATANDHAIQLKTLAPEIQ